MLSDVPTPQGPSLFCSIHFSLQENVNVRGGGKRRSEEGVSKKRTARQGAQSSSPIMRAEAQDLLRASAGRARGENTGGLKKGISKMEGGSALIFWTEFRDRIPSCSPNPASGWREEIYWIQEITGGGSELA